MKKILLKVLLVISISTTLAQVSQTVQITNFNFDCINPSFIKNPDFILDGKVFLAEVHRGDSSLIYIGNYNNDNDEFIVQQEFAPSSALSTNPIGHAAEWDKIQVYYFIDQNPGRDIATRSLINNVWSDEILITETAEDEDELTLVNNYSPNQFVTQLFPAIVFQRDSSIYLSEIINNTIKTSLIFEKNILGSFSSPASFYMSDNGAITAASILRNSLGQTQVVYRERNSFNDVWGMVSTVLDSGKIYHISFIDDSSPQFFIEADFGGGKTAYVMESWPINNQLVPLQDPALGQISNVQSDYISVIGSNQPNEFYIYGDYTYRLTRNDSDFVRTNYFDFGEGYDSLVFSKKKETKSTVGNVGFEYLGERLYTIWEDSADGYINLFGKKHVVPVGAVQDENIVEGYILEQNYPNPFNPSTIIQYTIPNVIASEKKQSTNVTLKVYDVLGSEVAALVNEEKPAGSYEVEFNTNGHSDAGQNLSSGVYYYQLRDGGQVLTRKMILMK